MLHLLHSFKHGSTVELEEPGQPRRIKLILLANKSDLSDSTQVDPVKLNKFANKNKLDMIFTAATQGINTRHALALMAPKNMLEVSNWHEEL